MHPLRIDSTWHTCIAAIRDANTEDTNIIRFDNAFYRACRAGGGQFAIALSPNDGGAADVLTLTLGAQDLYVAQVGGYPFDRYASTLDRIQIDAGTLNNAVREVKTATGTRLFELRSMLVFCVAESIRSDLISGKIAQTIRASMGTLLGASPRIPIGQMLPQARAWGQSSDAVWAALTPQVRAAFSKPLFARTPTERRLSERVNENAMDPALRTTARGVKVLKLPNI
jgi:hypothetical protein